jgi:hypothetical protein
MVIQNLYIIQGRPSWSSTFIISAINTCGDFSPLRFDLKTDGKVSFAGKQMDNIVCTAKANDKASGDVLVGPPVSIEMAIKEGWYGKNGSKWQTMPELMLRYRAAAFFGRLYKPEILNGMQTVEESSDLGELRNVTPEKEPESVVKTAEKLSEPSAENALNDGFSLETPLSVEEMIVKLEEYSRDETLPQTALREAQAMLESGEEDPEKLQSLLNKIKIAKK